MVVLVHGLVVSSRYMVPCFMQAQTPRRLIAFTRSKISAGSSAASVGGAWMPALLNAKSSRPKLATVRSTSAATCSSSDTSQNDAERLTARGGQLGRRGPEGPLVAVGKHDGGPGLGERLCCGEPHAGAGAGDDGNAVVEVVGRVHAVSG